MIYFFGLFIASDYGLSWDTMQRTTGIKAAAYIMKIAGIDNPKNIELNGYPHNIFGAYGVIFDLISIFIEEFFQLEDKKEIFTMRHQLNFTFYFFGSIFFFLLSKKLFNNEIATIATLIYILHPRLLAHGFFNPKDSILQSILVITLFTMYNALNNKKKWIVIAGLMSGICIATRIHMIYLPIIFSIIIILNSIQKNNKNIIIDFYLILKNISIYLSFSAFSLYFFWPTLWDDPINNFIEIFNLMKNFPWSGNVLFMGDIIKASNIPWYYIPTYITITTPVFFLILFIYGLYKITIKININKFKKKLFYILCILGLFIPLIAVITLKSNLYDGWRQFYFVYPFIAIIATEGLIQLLQKIKQLYKINYKNKLIMTIIIILLFIGPFFSIYSMHPHQNVYFNFFAGNDPMKNFEADYWGVSYKQALEILLDKTEGEINLSIGNFPGKNNLQMINKSDRKRINIVPFENAQFYLTNFRTNPKEYYRAKKKLIPFENEIYSIEYGEMKIIGLYKL